MVLDAPTYKTVLTPEAALGMVQKEIRHKGWKNVEIEDVRLVYTPYYVFGFDVSAESSAPISGKAGLNAYTGDIDEIVPMLLERPLTKQQKGEDGAEIEETSIPSVEAKSVARDKISVQTSVQRDRVAVSAVSKVYIPYYRIWGSVGHDSFRAQVDALMGSLVGLEAIHERPKTWSESTQETLNKMKTPSGLAELGGKTISTITGGGGGHGDGHGGGHGDSHGGGHGGGSGGILAIFEGKQARWVLLVLVILALGYYLFVARDAGSFKCNGSISSLGNQCVLNGACGFNNPKSEADYVTARISIFQQGTERLDLGQIVGQLVDAKGNSDQWQKEFQVNWTRGDLDCARDFTWKAGKV